MQKQVKIIGLSINEQFGNLKATSLQFNEENKLTTIKGEVGSGKTTLQRALKLGTQGSQTLEDKTLLGKIDIVTQLLDGDTNVFVGCKSNNNGSLDYFLYTTDENGKKIKDPVIDGKKATPAAYLKSLQTALTWNLNELTSENPVTQRNILLQLYQSELEQKGIYLDKSNPNYVGGIIDQIEKAKNNRSFADMKRKEVGGIADDMSKKGIDFSNRRETKDTKEIEQAIANLAAKITLAETNIEQTRETELTKIKNKGLELSAKLKTINDEIKEFNRAENSKKTSYERELDIYTTAKNKAKEFLFPFVSEEEEEDFNKDFEKLIFTYIPTPQEPELLLKKELEFNERGTCISTPEDFKEQNEIQQFLKDYKQIAYDYATLINKPLEEVDTSEQEKELEKLKSKLERYNEYNKEAKTINAYHDWKDENQNVLSLQKDYFLKLTEIETGVEGLYICPEYNIIEGEKVAKGNDIYLMYDGSYDPEYFSNPNKELRKLAAYSDTQKPMVCLLIQKYLLSKKSKVLPYLWIDQVPIDNKTKLLLDRMAEELGLWLFVNWTGDFDKTNLKDGEILIENGEIFEKPTENENN